MAGVHPPASPGDARLGGVHGAHDGPAIAHLPVGIASGEIELVCEGLRQFANPAGFHPPDLAFGRFQASVLVMAEHFAEGFRAWDFAGFAAEQQELHLCVPQRGKAVEMLLEGGEPRLESEFIGTQTVEVA